MTPTIAMIRRIRELQAQRGQWGIPTRMDATLSRALIYLRHRHFRDTGYPSPI